MKQQCYDPWIYIFHLHIDQFWFRCQNSVGCFIQLNNFLKAFFGCAYLEQNSHLKKIAYSFVFVMLLKEKMRYWLKADYAKNYSSVIYKKFIIKMLYRHILDLFYHSIIYLMCFSSASSRLDVFWRNVWKSISQENVFINIELGKSLFAHILCVPCIVYAIWIEFRYKSQINPMLLSKSSICQKRIVDDRSYMRKEIVSFC